MADGVRGGHAKGDAIDADIVPEQSLAPEQRGAKQQAYVDSKDRQTKQMLTAKHG
jgi:hypothetical protein